MITETAAIKEIVKANSMAVYQDAAQPSIRVVGKSLAQCTSLFATPIGRMAEIFEKNIHRYLDRLEGLKEDELISPNTRILVPVLERLRYTKEDKVAEYYAEILATASTKEHAGKVMVTFIEILNRLCGDEIKILEFMNSSLKNIVEVGLISDEDAKNFNLLAGAHSVMLKGEIPVIDVQLIENNIPGYRLMTRNFNLINDSIKLSEPQNIDSYIDNMISLGLLKREHERFAFEKIYTPLKEHKSLEEFKKKLPEGQRLEFAEGKIEITNLGRKLLELCSYKNI